MKGNQYKFPCSVHKSSFISGSCCWSWPGNITSVCTVLRNPCSTVQLYTKAYTRGQEGVVPKLIRFSRLASHSKHINEKRALSYIDYNCTLTFLLSFSCSKMSFTISSKNTKKICFFSAMNDR